MLYDLNPANWIPIKGLDPNTGNVKEYRALQPFEMDGDHYTVITGAVVSLPDGSALSRTRAVRVDFFEDRPLVAKGLVDLEDVALIKRVYQYLAEHAVQDSGEWVFPEGDDPDADDLDED